MPLPRVSMGSHGSRKVPMEKRYVVRLTPDERQRCREKIRKLSGGSQAVRRAQILLKADADGPAWTDRRIAEAFSCRTKTVENVRQRCVLEGFARALEGKKRETPPTARLLDGEQEAKVLGAAAGAAAEGPRRLDAAAAGAPAGRTGGGRVDQATKPSVGR